MKIAIFVCVLSSVLICTLALQTQKPCRLRQFQRGSVCVCDDSYCDSLDVPDPKNLEYVLVTSSSQGDRFSYSKGKINPPKSCKKQKTGANAILEIDSMKVYQTIRGFGGGWPGAVTFLLDRISPKMRECFFKSYFSSDVGMSYSHIRVPIGGCDFEWVPWAYNEYPENDLQLSNFTQLDQRDVARNKLFKEMAKVSNNNDVKILAAAWSPPIWMKENRQWYGLKNNQIKPEYYATWANYHVKWLELMDNDGVNVTSISTGNEPWVSQINDKFQETYWEPSKQAVWITNHFGPTIKNSKYAGIDIHGFDDNRIGYSEWSEGMNNGSKTAFDYLTTISFHAYSDKLTSPEILDKVQSQFPDKQIWYSEMCFGIEFVDKDYGPQLGLWSRAEELANILLSNFNHSMVGYYDWNMILNSTGGPNYVKGVTDAPVILSKDFKEMYKQPMFYLLAHFSRFIPPGSIRIEAKLTGQNTSVISALAFSRPDKKIAVVLYNNDTQTTLPLSIQDKITGTMKIKLKPKSINTLVYNIDNEDAPNKTNLFNIFILPNIWDSCKSWSIN